MKKSLLTLRHLIQPSPPRSSAPLPMGEARLIHRLVNPQSPALLASGNPDLSPPSPQVKVIKRLVLCTKFGYGIIYTRTVGDAGPYDLTTLSTQTSSREKELAKPNFRKFPYDTAPKANQSPALAGRTEFSQAPV